MNHFRQLIPFQNYSFPAKPNLQEPEELQRARNTQSQFPFLRNEPKSNPKCAFQANPPLTKVTEGEVAYSTRGNRQVRAFPPLAHPFCVWYNVPIRISGGRIHIPVEDTPICASRADVLFSFYGNHNGCPQCNRNDLCPAVGSLHAELIT